jgi:hypothetical protein
MPLTVTMIADLENLESSVDHFSMRQLLTDYAAAHPDGRVSLHNFMACDLRYADKLKPSAQFMKDSRTPDSAGAPRAVSRVAKPGPGRGARSPRTCGLTLERGTPRE